MDDELNEKLDKCCSLMIESYQDILTKRELLDKCLDEAYLNLSKARSLIGCTNLSILQVPTELDPIVTVDTSNVEKSQKTDDGDYELSFEETNFNLDIKKRAKDGSIPLPTWFGVLTPLSLKMSHKSFSRSLNLITSICELQIKLNNLQNVYKNLLNEKNKI